MNQTELNYINKEENSRFISTGLNTGLNPNFGINSLKHGSDNPKFLLTAMKKTLLKEAFKRQCSERPNRKTSEIYEVLQRLKNPDVSVIRQTKPIPRELLKSKNINGGSLTNL